MPWLRNEDAAIKARLQGLLVEDANAPGGGREVGVRYRLPTDELANLTYPVVIIEHAGIYPAQERMHEGYQQIPYAPEGKQAWFAPGEEVDVTKTPYRSFIITPYNLDYQITVYGRFWGAHIQPLIGQLALLHRLPAKAGRLWVPQDGTSRSMRLLGGPEEGYGLDEDGKRLFKVVYRVRVFSEVVEFVQGSVSFGGTLVPVSTVDIDLSVYADTGPIDLTTPTGIQQNIGILSIGAVSQAQVQQT